MKPEEYFSLGVLHTKGKASGLSIVGSGDGFRALGFRVSGAEDSGFRIDVFGSVA